MTSEKTFTGIVDWFDPKKCYGFITRDDGKKDIFVHYSDINMSGFKILMAGDTVSFEEGFTFKDKLKATNVIVLDRKQKPPTKK